MTDHPGPTDPRTASAVIDLGALRANLAAIGALVAPARVMLVVKANAYGHGMLPIARAARRAGIEWLGVATPQEAAALRADGDTGRVLAWLYGEDTELAPHVAAGIDLTAHRPAQLARLAAAARATGSTARVYLKADTGLHRNGARPEDWAALCAAAAEAETDGLIEVVGIWSHFASADSPEDPSIADQQAAYERAGRIAHEHGLRPPIRHLANSAGALATPGSRLDLVRIGIAGYGVDPADGKLAADAGLDLAPVMRLRAQLVAVKPLLAGESVSYGQTWTARTDTVVGLVPLGYADGVPVAASNVASARVGDRLAPIRGRVCMDQLVIDLGAGATERPGDEVVLFGAPEGPRAEDWARETGTIGYEILTRVSGRGPRVLVEEPDA